MYSYKYKIKTNPAVEPVTYADTKTHLRLLNDEEQSYVTDLIKLARVTVEKMANRALITQHWYMYLDEFPSRDDFKLPWSPVQSITSITYLDTLGATQTLSTDVYTLDDTQFVSKVALKYNQEWPTTYDQINAITIEYVAGYGDTADSVPVNFIHAIKLLVTHYYENRIAVNEKQAYDIAKTVDFLIDFDRVVYV